MKKSLLTLLFVIFIVSIVEGYDNDVVHQAINENAAKQSSNLLILQRIF